MKFKKALLVESGRFEIREVEENPGRGQILVKVASCGLCNWELNFWQESWEQELQSRLSLDMNGQELLPRWEKGSQIFKLETRWRAVFQRWQILVVSQNMWWQMPEWF